MDKVVRYLATFAAFFSFLSFESAGLSQPVGQSGRQAELTNQNISPSRVAAVVESERFRNSLNTLLQAEYDRLNIGAGETVYVAFEDDGFFVGIKDKVDTDIPSTSLGQVSQIGDGVRTSTGRRNFVPFSVKVDGVDYPGFQGFGPNFTLNTCNPVIIEGTAKLNVIGAIESRVYLEKDGNFSSTDKKTAAGLISNFLHPFSFQLPLPTGQYALKHEVGNLDKETYPFTVSNTAQCAVAPSLQVRSHVQDYGWQSWVGNSDVSGTTGQGKRLEALEIKALSGSATPMSICYQVRSKGIGWSNTACDGAQAGTTGQNRSIDEIKIWIQSSKPAGCLVRYQSYIGRAVVGSGTGLGWTGFSQDGGVSGNTANNRRIEAVRVELVNC